MKDNNEIPFTKVQMWRTGCVTHLVILDQSSKDRSYQASQNTGQNTLILTKG